MIDSALSTEGNERKHHLQNRPELPIAIHVLRGLCRDDLDVLPRFRAAQSLRKSLCSPPQKESPDLSRQSPANGHASVTSSILVRLSHRDIARDIHQTCTRVDSPLPFLPGPAVDDPA